MSISIGTVGTVAFIRVPGGHGWSWARAAIERETGLRGCSGHTERTWSKTQRTCSDGVTVEYLARSKAHRSVWSVRVVDLEAAAALVERLNARAEELRELDADRLGVSRPMRRCGCCGVRREASEYPERSRGTAAKCNRCREGRPAGTGAVVSF